MSITPLAVKNRIEESYKLEIYPNPAIDFLIIEIPFKESGDGVIKIYDVEGKLLISSTISWQLGGEKNKLNITSLNHGIYFINITNDKSYSGKFVK